MNIAVYCGSNPGASPEFLESAWQLGTWIGQSGNTLVYGGSSIGLMGAVSRATMEAGGVAVGVEPRFFIQAGVAQHDLTELVVVDTMEERKATMIARADVFVALPGGVGTLEEIAEILSRQRLCLSWGPCYFLNQADYYEGLRLQLKAMVDAHFLDKVDFDDIIFCSTVAQLTERLAAHKLKEPPDEHNPRIPESNL